MELHAAQLAAERLMVGHGLTAAGWIFRFDHSKLRFGVCRHHRKVISLSRHLTELNNEEQVIDTIKHEIAHAIVGVGHGHDATWKRMAAQCGAKPERCYDHGVTQPKGKYQGVCMDCGHTFERYKALSARQLASGYHLDCRKAHKPNRGKIEWRSNGSALLPTANTTKPALAQSDISVMWERLKKLEEKL